MKITEYEIVDHGIDNSQYFQGCGTVFTDFEHVSTGCGNDFADAIEDALESMAQRFDVNVTEFEERLRTDLNSPVKRGMPSARCWPQSETVPEESEDCFYYVSIRYSVEAK